VTGGTNRSTILNERAARISRCPSPSVDEIIPARNATTQAMTSHMTGNPEPVFEASCALDRIDRESHEDHAYTEPPSEEARQ
jgi:hypothetical protein